MVPLEGPGLDLPGLQAVTGLLNGRQELHLRCHTSSNCHCQNVAHSLFRYKTIIKNIGQERGRGIGRFREQEVGIKSSSL